MNAPETVVTLDAAGHVIHQSERAIGAILVGEGKLDSGDIEKVMEVQRDKGLRFGEAALRLGLVNPEDLHRAVARQYDFPAPLATGSAGAELVVARAPFHPCAEELRALRTQLQIRWSNAGVNPRLLAIASPGSGEGRSYLAANLAVAFAQLGERTLLVDADLRSPRQHRIFGLPASAGLSAVLSGRADRGALVALPDFGPLSILPAGAVPPNPQELLSRAGLPALLRELRAEFDVILFDTPPARHCADAQSVAFRAGHALVLARRHHTRLADASAVVRELGDTGARVLGTVCNAF